MNKNTKQQLNSPITVKNASVLFDFAIIIRLIFTFAVGILMLKITFPTLLFTIINYVISPISIVLAILLLLKKGLTFPDLKRIIIPKKCDFNSILATVLITIGMFFGLSKLNDLFVSFLENLGLKGGQAVSLPDKSFFGIFVCVIFICTLPAFFEELLFRGFITNGLKNAGEVFAIILTGILFSLSHMNPAQTIYQFIVGVLYSLIIIRGGNYLLTFCSHFLNNLLIVLNYYFWGFNPSGIYSVLLAVVGILSLVGGVILLIKNKKENAVSEKKISFIYGLPVGIIACVILWIIGLVG